MMRASKIRGAGTAETIGVIGLVAIASVIAFRSFGADVKSSSDCSGTKITQMVDGKPMACKDTPPAPSGSAAPKK